MDSTKKGQVEVTFNWVYVLIAGAVIILFFVGIAARQKTSSQQALSGDLVRIMESIFASAGASEKTKNVIPVGGLADYTFQFSCDNGVSEFSIKETESQRRQNAIDPIFSPAEIKTTQFVLWSLPYKLPFKVIDFLFVSSSNTKYVLLGDRDGFAEEFMAETNEFNREQVYSLADVDPGKNFQIQVVDFAGTFQDVTPVNNPALAQMDNDKVTAVSFVSGDRVQYYQKSGMVFVRTHHNPLSVISLDGEKDAARYAAIFSGNQDIYQCNIQKAMVRLQKIADVYTGKEEQLIDYYEQRQRNGEGVGQCLGHLRDNRDNNLAVLLSNFKYNVDSCVLSLKSGLESSGISSCNNLLESAGTIQQVNRQMGNDCFGVTLY